MICEYTHDFKRTRTNTHIEALCRYDAAVDWEYGDEPKTVLEAVMLGAEGFQSSAVPEVASFGVAISPILTVF